MGEQLDVTVVSSERNNPRRLPEKELIRKFEEVTYRDGEPLLVRARWNTIFV
jgi:hypothetical protein